MINEEIFKKLEAFAEIRRDDFSENAQYWAGYLDGLRRLYRKITATTNFEKIKSMTLEEMAESTIPFFACPYGLSYEDCDDGNCIECTKEWLELEVKD